MSAAGLANATGEYNCFLNVVIQCLWHCSDFSNQLRQFMDRPGELQQLQGTHTLVFELLRLFKDLDEAEQEWTLGGTRCAPLLNAMSL